MLNIRLKTLIYRSLTYIQNHQECLQFRASMLDTT